MNRNRCKGVRTCVAQSRRFGFRGTRTRSCLNRPTRNSWASISARRGDSTEGPLLEYFSLYN